MVEYLGTTQESDVFRSVKRVNQTFVPKQSSYAENTDAQGSKASGKGRFFFFGFFSFTALYKLQ